MGENHKCQGGKSIAIKKQTNKNSSMSQGRKPNNELYCGTVSIAPAKNKGQ